MFEKNNKMTEFEKLVDEVRFITTPTPEKAQEVINNIRRILKQYVEDSGLKSLVLGVSGGLDSAVVAAICQEKYIGVPLIGLSIPISSSDDHREQAEWVGKTYCSAFEEFREWDDEADTIFEKLESTDRIAKKAGFDVKEFPKNVLQGNMKARIRMITLFDLARKTNGMVMSTDNDSEYQMAFWTIFGDEGNFGPIQNIGKGFELPVLAKVLGIDDGIIDQKPSDGLKVSEEDSDEAQLGANYREVDTITNIYLERLPISNVKIGDMKSRLLNLINKDDVDGAKKIAKIINRYHNMSFKRNGTINLTREEIGI